MKKTILTFGLISGAVSSAMMLIAAPFWERIGFDRAEIVGYTTIILSMLLVFFGIKSYRDNVPGGEITFGKAFKVGLAIMVISCLCYVITWEVLYFTVLHSFTDKYASHMIDKARASGASEAAIQAQMEQMKQFKVMYENPLINSALTFIEPFPIGLVITLISAALLRKKSPPAAVAQAV